MIVAAGLTPAWQQTMCFAAFAPGEVNRARQVHWCASGKVVNVAVATACLGAPCRAVVLAGGQPGEWIQRELQEFGIDCRLVTSHGPTRICTTILDESSGHATEVVENAGPISDDELQAFQRTYSEAAAEANVTVLSGSLPPRSPTSFYRELLALAGCPAVVDARGPELLDALAERPLLVKPNREELARTLGRALPSEDDVRDAMRELNDRGAQWALVTQGRQPALASHGGSFYRFIPPQVQAVNPIGSGDCLAAAAACALAQGKPMLDALRLGIAAGSANATSLLPGRIESIRVLELAEAVRVESC